jgi:hypothetical protein
LRIITIIHDDKNSSQESEDVEEFIGNRDATYSKAKVSINKLEKIIKI